MSSISVSTETYPNDFIDEKAPLEQNAPVASVETEPLTYEDAYCRLCATRAPPHRLQSFTATNPPSEKLFASIRRLAIGIRRGDGLPQVVCDVCTQRLASVETFVQGIASAQTILTAMYMPEQLHATFDAETAKSDDSVSDSSDSSADDETFKKRTRKSGKRSPAKRRNPKRAKAQLSKLKKKLDSTSAYDSAPVNITIEPDFPQPSHKVPVKSEDPLIRHWSDFFCCKRCDHKTQTLQQLREHSWQNHNRCIVFKCIECPGQITTYKRFIRHMIKHNSTLEQCCEYCNECYISPWEVLIHKGLDHSDEAKPHKCTRCGTSFNTAAELQTHQDSFVIVKSKGAGNRRFKCIHCDKEFLNNITLQSHLECHDPTKNICTLCNKSFKNKYILSQHNEFVHNDHVRFVCQVCGKGFKVKQHLKRHVDVHNDVRPFSCSKCDKRFRSPGQLKSHQICHSDESTFSCNICSKAYKFRAGLRDHMRAHNNERPYSCDTCDRTFVSWSNFNKHMKAIHKKNMAKSQINNVLLN